MEDNVQIVFILIFALLDLVLIKMFISSISDERRSVNRCEKMSAEIRSVTSQRIPSKRAFAPDSMMYIFVVKADNGCLYEVKSRSGTAYALKVGDTVEILVPDGASAIMEEKERFDRIISGGKEALETLSQEEKVRLNEYLDRRFESGMNHVSDIMNNNLPSLASDGRGKKQEIISVGVLAAVMSLFAMLCVIHIIVDL